MGILSFLGSLFSEKIGVNPYSRLGLMGLSGAFFCASYKTESKNIQADKSKMKYRDFLRTKQQEEALDVIMDGISLGRKGMGFNTLKKITALAPCLYKAENIVHYHESGGKIHGVHTLRHLGYVFSKKDTRQKMQVVMNYSGFLKIVKTTYLQKMSEVLNQLNGANQIVPYLTDFVEEITKIDNMSKSRKKQLVEKQINIIQKNSVNKWEEFIQFLLRYTI